MNEYEHIEYMYNVYRNETNVTIHFFRFRNASLNNIKISARFDGTERISTRTHAKFGDSKKRESIL